MTYQMTFKRYELKYLLNRQEKEQILLAMQSHMKLDTYGRTIIRNIYFDTDTFRLIRRSLEKPVYKEKLRIRSYKPVEAIDPVFVEIKKKYKSVVYKRRLQLPEEKVMESFQTGEPLPVHSQIGNEIQYFRDYYENLHPSVFLSYEREAYYALDDSDFRVTLDEKNPFLCDRVYFIIFMKHCVAFYCLYSQFVYDPIPNQTTESNSRKMMTKDHANAIMFAYRI